MNIEARDYFLNKLREILPNTTFFSDWPDDSVSSVYPFASLMMVSSRPAKFVGSSAKVLADNKFSTGLWTTTFNLHYFYDDQEQVNTARQAIIELFQDQEQEQAQNLTLKFGPAEYQEAEIRLGDMILDSDSSSLRKGENRLIWDFEMQSITFTEQKLPRGRFSLETDISEKAGLQNV